MTTEKDDKKRRNANKINLRIFFSISCESFHLTFLPYPSLPISTPFSLLLPYSFLLFRSSPPYLYYSILSFSPVFDLIPAPWAAIAAFSLNRSVFAA